MAELLKNDSIPTGLYFLIETDGRNVGRKPLPMIKNLSKERDLDFVLVNAETKTIKLFEKVDESKRNYEEAKRAKQNKQKEIKTKSYTVDKPLAIQQNDLDRKMNEVIKAVLKNFSVTFSFKALGRYSDDLHWHKVVERFEECVNYILTNENVQCQTKKENENIVYAIFRYKSKK